MGIQAVAYVCLIFLVGVLQGFVWGYITKEKGEM